MHHHPPNQERAINLSILTVSGPGEFPRVESNLAAGSTPGGALPSTHLSFSPAATTRLQQLDIKKCLLWAPLWVASRGAQSSNSAGVCGRALEHKRTVIDFWPLRVLSLALHKQCGSLVCLQGWYFWCLWLFWFCTTMEKGVAAGPGEGGGWPMFAQRRITGKDRNANKHMVVLTALQKCVVVLFLVPLVFWF